MKPEYIDTHAHTNFSDYDSDRDSLIKNTLSANTWMINVGTEEETSKSAVVLAEKYEKGVYATIGLHPTSEEVFSIDFYRNLAKSKKVVAIGECGLDFFRVVDEKAREKQVADFRAQIELSIELDLPLMLHVRNAYKEVLSILKEYPKARGNVHFFAGSIDEAKAFLDLGFTLSFTGVITFAREYEKLVKAIPLDKILSETDCPYVTPVPYRGKRNEPMFVSEVANKIARIKGEDVEVVKKQLVENAFRVFRLDI